MVSYLRLLFWVVSHFPFYRPIPAFYGDIPDFYTRIPFYSFTACCTARALRKWKRVGWGMGYPGWHGGIPGLVRVFTQACVLTRQHNFRFRIPVRLPFPQGNWELKSVGHQWLGFRDRNCDVTIYPLPYLREGFIPFWCRDLTQLRKYD